MPIWELIARSTTGVVLIGLNAFFVVTEFALTRLRQFDESKFQDHPGLKKGWEMTEKLEIYLTGCQLGITSTSVLLGVIAEPAITHLVRPLVTWTGISGATESTVSIVVALIFINLIHKIWGEQAPTYLGVEKPLLVARYASVPHYWWCKVMYPFIILGDGLAKWTLRLFGVEIHRSWTEAEEEGTQSRSESEHSRGAHPEDDEPRSSFAQVRQQIGEVLSRGSLPPDRRREVIRALEIDRIPVRRIMVPRDEVSAVDECDDIEVSLRKMADEKGLSRFPLVDGSLDRPLGTLYLAAVFRHLESIRRGDRSLREIAAAPVTVDHHLPVSKLIDRLQHEHQELAFVECENRIVGLVTITDALEAIAGDLRDPLDKPA